jgi:hypothetical protein
MTTISASNNLVVISSDLVPTVTIGEHEVAHGIVAMAYSLRSQSFLVYSSDRMANKPHPVLIQTYLGSTYAYSYSSPIYGFCMYIVLNRHHHFCSKMSA